MAAFIARVSRLYPNAGRNQNQTYVHVVNGYQSLGSAVPSLAQWLLDHPTSPWNDPQYNEYVVELADEAEYQNRLQFGVFWDNKQNLPKSQQLAGNTGSPREFGAYSDPTNAGSTWVPTQSVKDTRFILRVYDDDPVAQPSATHIGEEEFDETPATIITRYIRLFNDNNVPINNNSVNQRTDVGGKLMDFDFGSSHSPPLSAGVTTFGVSIDRTGPIPFFSNHQYRFAGPIDEEPNYYQAKIFGKVLRASLE